MNNPIELPNMVPLISLRHISRTFTTGGGVQVQALKHVSLDIYAGEFVSIIGQSGSGKSTLMNILGCLDRPTSGTYQFAGQDIRLFDADGLAWLRREAFGFVFQSYNLLGNSSAQENVEVPAIYAGDAADERQKRAKHLLGSLGIGDRADHRPSQLSGGQQQRVSIARALMNGGQVILADEPTGALDSQSGIDVMNLLRELADQGHTVILITHDHEIANNADRRIELLDGEILHDSGTVHSARLQNAVSLYEQMRNSSKPRNRFSEVYEAANMAFRSLRANVFRTALTLLGIVIGVASVIAMLAIGEGAQKDVIDRINSLGADMLTVSPLARRGSESETLTLEDALAIEHGVSNVKATLPEITGSETLRAGSLDYTSSITATTSNLPETRSWPLAQGVFFSDQDSTDFAPVAVIGSTVKESLFSNNDDPLGQYLLIKNVPFQIIGVMSSKGSSGFGGRDQDDVVLVPLKTGGLRLFGRTYLRSLTIEVKDPELIDQTEQQVRNLLTQRHGTEDFRLRNSAELLENVTASQQTFTTLLGSVAAISLLVGGIGVMNIMLVSVTERTREIGIRIATGARQNDILLQFLTEAIVVSALGGLLGVVIGFGVGVLIENFGTSVVFSSGPTVLAFSCAAGIGLIFGFAPASKAAKLDPVVALATD
ncbi:macrolide export ATP-binding/permease protein MacB [Arenicella chitinivorans]|uniref:Pyoverdine export ATP-binding/permease protein PvdT n=1 Tax=Arenicella chitinivorans TaxID=1329800 RepID=A0A918RID0_9GAMM|nr:MacB family efflux pump subunit [Arenicella chitinivorans]GHA00062.1 macrolide export ATP-binding/permease protein MacB [Arenicella chitinivorans]